MVEEKDDRLISSKCSVCGKMFASVKICFRHELLKHSLHKKSGPNNFIQKSIKATTNFLNTDEKILERQRLHQGLSSCEDGEELKTIIKLVCVKSDDLGLVFTRIQTCLETELQSWCIPKVYPFGSITSGLALRDCDIDVYIDVCNMKATPKRVNPHPNEMRDSDGANPFNCITKALKCSRKFSHVVAIRNARVPIIKCKHKDTGFSVDINVSYPSSRENSKFIHDLVQSDKRIRELMLFLKLWAKNMQIVVREIMSSYCLLNMIIFFLQQPQQIVKGDKETREDSRILKSMKELQANCPYRIVQGVNYAYDIKSKENEPKIPLNVTTLDLVRGFFDFYTNFNFEDNVISPFYGKAIAKTNLTPDICEEYYKQLKTITQYLEGEPAKNLQVKCCMCVQDVFFLNHNNANKVMPKHKQYILMCLYNAKKICENAQFITRAQLYEKLLFETVNKNSTENIKKMKTDLIEILNNRKVPAVNHDLSLYTIVPSRADLRTLAAHYPKITKSNQILQCWCQHYIDVISIILTQFYRMDMQKQMHTQQKVPKRDKEENDSNLGNIWTISCTIDLWTNRCFEKNYKIALIDYQLQQTERLYNLRKQDPKFSVTLNGILKVNILPKNMGIEIKFELPDDVNVSSLPKKSPTRKFFNMFKNTLESFGIKNILNIDNANATQTNESANNADTVTDTVNTGNS